MPKTRAEIDDMFAVEAGFSSFKEREELVDKVNLSIPGMCAKFSKWKATDGTKSGLEELIKNQNQSGELPSTPQTVS